MFKRRAIGISLLPLAVHGLAHAQAGTPTATAGAAGSTQEPVQLEEENASGPVPNAASTDAGSSSSSKAEGQKTEPLPGSIPDLRGAKEPTQRAFLGLDPGAPQAVGIVGGTTPAYGEVPTSKNDWVFDIHGYLLLPLRVGTNSRFNPGPGQNQYVLHTPPEVPGAYGTFDYTGINPGPWAQLNFSYGSKWVTATVIVAARTVSNANGYFNPPDQLGINDAFITFTPGHDNDSRLAVNVGAFANRYGIMGEYDLGPYGTETIARVGGVGATGSYRFSLSSIPIVLEGGVTGQFNKTPVAVEPAGWNGYSDPNAGTSFALHGHLGVRPWDGVDLGAHVFEVAAQDDRATNTTQKDGSIGVYGADARFSMRRFGHLYLSYAHTAARTARSVSSVIRVLGAPGGLGLMQQYLGMDSEGTGSLDTFGAQYDFSLGTFVRHPKPFDGKGPDLALAVFGVGTAVRSPVPGFDGQFKFKYGAAVTYSFLPYLGIGTRFDQVMNDVSQPAMHHSILSPRLIFKSGWSSRDQVVLQYSRYFYGGSVLPAPDPAAPPVGAGSFPTLSPDENVISLTASMWW